MSLLEFYLLVHFETGIYLNGNKQGELKTSVNLQKAGHLEVVEKEERPQQ